MCLKVYLKRRLSQSRGIGKKRTSKRKRTEPLFPNCNLVFAKKSWHRQQRDLHVYPPSVWCQRKKAAGSSAVPRSTDRPKRYAKTARKDTSNDPVRARLTLKLTRIHPRTVRAAGTRSFFTATAAHDNLLPDRHDPFTLQQLRRTRSPLRISIKAPLQELDPLGTQLVFARQLRRVALRDVVHDGPLVVETGPRSTAGAHLEYDAAERPHVDGAVTAFVVPFDHFG